MQLKLKTFAVISADRGYGKKLSQDLLALCRENGCNFLFRVFANVGELQDDVGFDAVTHIILVSECGGSRVVRELRKRAVDVPVMLLTKSTDDMQALFRQTDTYGANPPQSKEDLAYIMNLLYGSDNRFLPEGRRLQILTIPPQW